MSWFLLENFGKTSLWGSSQKVCSHFTAKPISTSMQTAHDNISWSLQALEATNTSRNQQTNNQTWSKEAAGKWTHCKVYGVNWDWIWNLWSCMCNTTPGLYLVIEINWAHGPFPQMSSDMIRGTLGWWRHSNKLAVCTFKSPFLEHFAQQPELQAVPLQPVSTCLLPQQAGEEGRKEEID